MLHKIEIAPSILSADFARLGEEVMALEQAGADVIHLDVMDGHFVPNITFGPPVVKALRRFTNLPFEAHLMIHPADPYIEAFAKAGADIIIVHPEQNPQVGDTIKLIQSFGLKAGIALNPQTPIEVLERLAYRVDLILVMTVQPGFGGQSFMADQLNKIQNVANLIAHTEQDIVLEVDGGINHSNAHQVITAGATRLVAGTTVFKDGPNLYEKNIAQLRKA